MGTLFRSQVMSLRQLFLQTEAAYACVSELGELGLVQFRDLNPDVNAFQRKFVNEIRRCDEMERKLRFLEAEIKKDTIPMLDTGDNPEAPAPREMIDLEATFEKLENELREVNSNAEQLRLNFLNLTELKHILRKTQSFFDETFEQDSHDRRQALHDPSLTEEQIGLLGEEGLRAGGQQSLQLGFVAGVIPRERLVSFERMLWRACRGNVFLKQAEIETPLEDPATGDQVYKSVFIIFFQGDQLKSRVKKICEAFRATLYPCPDSQAERREMAIGVMTRIEDLNTVLNQTQEHRHRVLVAAAKNLKLWFLKVRKIKAIYHTLNQFNLDVTTKCLIGECWCAVDDLDKINLALRRGTERSGSSVQPILNGMVFKESPPTYHRVNKFTTAFQNIVDAYGVANYREANPAPFTCITFPFLFAVMFGDAGHGLIMFLFALWMVMREKQLGPKTAGNEMATTIFGGRYIILLMGACSIYTGLIYNDVFSKSLNVFGSGWYPGQFDNSTIHANIDLQLDPNDTRALRGVYPFGVDPVWQLSKNKITFTNSLKMKMSIIFGVVHMLFGVFVSLTNHIYFKDMLSIFLEFIPQVLFLTSIFGYLIILIFYKWIAFLPKDAACAPSLLIGLINMFLLKYDTVPGCNPIYSGYQGLQTFLVLLALFCVPWMLLPKPLILRHLANKKSQEALHSFAPHGTNGDSTEESAVVQMESSPAPTGGHGHGHDEKFDFGEVFVHQCIHTIEYCLGCISNTASYLRLWALSLAHAQLSEVLWTMVLHIGLGMDSLVGGAMLIPCFAVWAVLTVAVLLLMEGLSAFLHALRLHWVEFQNKFYKGTGYKFQPFSFKKCGDMHDG